MSVGEIGSKMVQPDITETQALKEPRRASVTFSNVVIENGPKIDLESVPESPIQEKQVMLSPKSKRPVARIPTEIKLKTITHKVKRPAVDIEFHDLVYTVKTTSGKVYLFGCNFFFFSPNMGREILLGEAVKVAE